MRTVTFNEFAAMPAGTIFRVHGSDRYPSIYRKGETAKGGKSFSRADITDPELVEEPSDGLTHRKYDVYEAHDIFRLVRMLVAGIPKDWLVGKAVGPYATEFMLDTTGGEDPS